jgi:hypothetical protein
MTPEKRDYVIESISRYWPGRCELIASALTVHHKLPINEVLPARGEAIVVPSWATDIAVDGGLLVPQWAADQARGGWESVDWVAVCFWYLNNLAERAHEQRSGPIHSYSGRLKGWDSRFWQYAWVNRIALFLRRWVARINRRDEHKLFGPPPRAELYLTHDVDAVEKTLAIRFKQSVFHSINALRFLLSGRFVLSASKAAQAARFLVSGENYWCFDQILDLEQSHGVKSIFNFYAGKPGNQRNIKQRLLDPAYDVNQQRLSTQIRKMQEKGWVVGLHQSFDSWRDEVRMRVEKSNLEKALGGVVSSCRQHWLRFSFQNTWKIQQNIGLKQDTTLGFNDRPGFRNCAALAFHPWDEETNGPMSMESIPMVLMDSHFYDYQSYNDCQRKENLKKWLTEINLVGGVASIVWHQRVMSRDYGWADGYKYLLQETSNLKSI